MSTPDGVGPAERARRSKRTCLVWRGNGGAREAKRVVCGRIGVCYVSWGEHVDAVVVVVVVVVVVAVVV